MLIAVLSAATVALIWQSARLDAPGSADPSPVATTAGAERVTAFYPLEFSAVPISGGRLVRMEVPPSALEAFGVPDIADSSTPTTPDRLLADVLVGDDGLARAVRFVRSPGVDVPRSSRDDEGGPTMISKRATAIVVLWLLRSGDVLAQAPPEPPGGPLGPPVANAPFSADATTTVLQVLADGTRIERTAKARYFRDRIGRVRVEQMIMGLDALNPAAEGQVRITISPDPASGAAFTVDPQARTFAAGPRSAASAGVGGGRGFALPVGRWSFLTFTRGDQSVLRYGIDESAVLEEDLGTRRIEGVEAAGRRLTTTIPAGSRVGNDRPITIVDERWESAELQILISARHSNPLTGIVDYRLSNIRRVEPPAHMFQVPEDYTELAATGNAPWIELKFAEPPSKSTPIRR
jgi:hypothetical protein